MKLKRKEVVSPKGLKPKRPWNTMPKAHEGKERKEKKFRSKNGRRTNVKELSRDPQRLAKARDPRDI